MNKRQLLYIRSLYEMRNADEEKEMTLFRNMFNLYCELSTEEKYEVRTFYKNFRSNQD